MGNAISGVVFISVIYVIIPIALAKNLIGANWPQIGVAYAILYAGILCISLGGSTSGEKLGWVMILGLFLTIPGIPILSLLVRVFGFARQIGTP